MSRVVELPRPTPPAVGGVHPGGPQPGENRLTAAFLVVALVALFGGALTGLLQALEHAGVHVPGQGIFVKSYYQTVSLHGVLNVLVWTTFFISGFMPFLMVRALGRPLASLKLGWLTFWLMVGGLGVAAIPLVTNAATVMFTFYPPLTPVAHSMPAVAVTDAYRGPGLGESWDNHGRRSAFVGTFAR